MEEMTSAQFWLAVRRARQIVYKHRSHELRTIFLLGERGSGERSKRA